MISVNIEEVAYICNLSTKTAASYRTGADFPEPALTGCDCCGGKILRWDIEDIIKYKLDRIRHSHKNVNHERVKQLSAAGVSRAKIGKMFKVPTHIIEYICVKNGYKSKISVRNKPKKEVKTPPIVTAINEFLATQLKGK